MASIEKLTSDLDALERMTDAELLEYFKDVLHITRPNPKQREMTSILFGEGAKPKKDKVTTKSLSAQAEELLAKLNEMQKKGTQK